MAPAHEDLHPLEPGVPERDLGLEEADALRLREASPDIREAWGEGVGPRGLSGKGLRGHAGTARPQVSAMCCTAWITSDSGALMIPMSGR